MLLWPEQREQGGERVEVARARSHRAVEAMTVTWGYTLSGFGAGCDMTRVMFLKPHWGCGVENRTGGSRSRGFIGSRQKELVTWPRRPEGQCDKRLD